MTISLRNLLSRRRSRGVPSRFLDDRSALVTATDRERMRTDRNSSPFCLTIFRSLAETRDEVERDEQALIAHLCGRLRTNDQVGRWQSDVAALLVDTPRGGAALVVAEALESIGRAGSRFAVEVRAYPDDDAEFRDRSGVEDGSAASPGIEAVGAGRATAAEPAADSSPFFLRELTPPVPLWKRTFDVTAAAFGLLATSPILIAAAVAIKRDSPGPILFAQRRTGRRGEPFVMYKFRTMTVDAESKKASLRAQSVQDGPAFKLDHDPRITPVGAILRKTCIDELPQLWNVLRGEMSIVGPRPLPVDEAEKCEDWQRRRHAALPGLTCYWQALGSSRVPFREWMRLDLRYVGTISPWVDLCLIFRTLTQVVLARASR